jgi:MurNAc alpha-1-phosphate uridylyltransferase
MLFAAGFGTRMGALTANRPKPLIPVGGRALIDHTLDLALAIKPKRIVANTHYLAQMMADHLEPLGVALSHEDPDILDTGGGLFAALPLLGPDPVFTMNTDAIWAGPNPLDLLQSAWNPDKMDALLMCVPLAQTVGYTRQGDFVLDAQGRISWGSEQVYGGVQIIKTDGLEQFQERAFSMHLPWNKMLADQRFFGISYPGRWCDVGHPGGLAQAEALLANHDV